MKTTREHVPPRVFFPSSDDVGTSYGDLRKNLLTVPSCEEHNTAYSLDDEYVAFCVAMAAQSEPLGGDQFLSKIVRAFQHSPDLQRRFDQDITNEGLMKIDIGRFRSVMTKIACALHWYHLGSPLHEPVEVESPSLHPDGRRDYVAVVQPDPNLRPGRCPVPAVFAYDYASAGVGDILLNMTFYGRFRVTAATRRVMLYDYA